MKIIAILLCLVCAIGIVAADDLSNTTNLSETNATTNVTNITNVTVAPTPILPPPEEFYGKVEYNDGSPVESGRQIRALNQDGIEVGVFNMTVNGTYGDMYKSSPRLIVNALDDEDVITFYVDDIKSSKSMKFDSAGIKRADIVIPSTFKPTPVPTTIATPDPTPEPTTIVPTESPTPVIVPTTTTIPPTTPPTTKPTPVQTPLTDNSTLFKFVGVLLIALGVCVAGAIATYYVLSKKMAKEEEEIILEHK